MREDILSLLPSAFFESPLSFIQGGEGKVITESKLRWAAIFTLSNGRRIFFKRDKTKGWIEYLKYFVFPSKGRKEWFVAYQSGKRHLNIPRPLGWMEHIHRGLVRESYYLSEAIGSGVSLIEETDRLREEQTFNELVKIVRRMHDSGLYHRDLHAGNFLWDGESLFLTDLHRARILKSLSVEQRLANLSHLFHSLRSIWEEGEWSRFLERYFAEDPISPQKRESFLQKIHSGMDRLQRRQWQSRSRRCLKESTEFSVRKEMGTTVYHRKDFSFDRLKGAVERHLFLVKERPFELLKKSPEVKVSLFRDGEERVCVKQFCSPGLWDRLKERSRLSKGMKAWVGGNGLSVRGMNSIKPLALMERKGLSDRPESFLVMEVLERGQELDRYILKGFGNLKEKRYFIQSFAKWLSRFHRNNLYHRDMKTCNIFVSGGGKTWDFNLLDLEDVCLDKRVNEEMLFKNFLQLNTSTPRIITRTDRLRFFDAYHKSYPMIKNKNTFLSRLIQKSRDRGIVYVSPHGVVEEKFN
jgi:tRNA A-37 threonylcarbamoyl transferase component Bud32